jgi:hypothetical protein
MARGLQLAKVKLLRNKYDLSVSSKYALKGTVGIKYCLLRPSNWFYVYTYAKVPPPNKVTGDLQLEIIESEISALLEKRAIE